MNRKSVWIVMMVLVSATAFGATSFTWFDFGNTVDDLSLNRTVLTYTSSDSTPDFDTSEPFQTTYGNDTFFEATPTIVLANQYFTGELQMADDSLVGRYAYAVIVDLDFGSYISLGAIPGGTKFGVSNIAEDSTNPGTPWAIYKTDGAIPNPTQNFLGGPVNLIPEPASAALLVLGGAAAFWRRRRNRR